MVSLTISSILVYVLLICGSLDEIRTPDKDVLSLLAVSCLVYHASFLVYCKKRGYGFLTITAFFFWVFMGIAPLMCSLTGRWLWGDISYEMRGEIVYASIMAIIFWMVFLVGNLLFFRRGVLLKRLLAGRTLTDSRLFSGLCFSIAMGFAVFAGLGVEGTFFRTGYDTYLVSGFTAPIIHNFIRPMPLLIGVPMLWIQLQQRSALVLPRTWLAIATVFVALAVNFPLSVARFYGWTVVSVIFYYAYLKRGNNKNYAAAGLFLILGFFGSFVVDVARYARSTTEMRENFEGARLFSADALYAGHVDSFEILTYGISYVNEVGPTMGRQLMGVLLFWIPRELWEDKPVATGPLLGGSFINIMQRTQNTNLAAPIVLEGLINFGILGVLLFGFVFGSIAGVLDRAILERRSLAPLAYGRIYAIDAIAAPLLGLWVYILRGSLLSSIAFSVGIVSAGILMWAVFFRRESIGR